MKKIILSLFKLLLCINAFSACSAANSGPELKLNINGVVKNSTCLIEMTKNISFDFVNALKNSSSTGFGSGISTKSDWSDSKQINFNCPSNLLLRAQLVGRAHPASNSYIMSNDRSINGFAFILGYAYPNDDKNEIALFSFDSKVNLLNPSNQKDTTIRTKAGVNTVYLYAQLVQVAEHYRSGSLNSAVTLNISYQ